MSKDKHKFRDRSLEVIERLLFFEKKRAGNKPRMLINNQYGYYYTPHLKKMVKRGLLKMTRRFHGQAWYGFGNYNINRTHLELTEKGRALFKKYRPGVTPQRKKIDVGRYVIGDPNQ